MQVACSCGKILNVPETLVGKTARCPACQKTLQMPGAAPAATSASRIVLTCSCGKKLAAPAAAAGKKVRCPKCNKELAVPAPAKPPSAPVITPMPPQASYAAAPAAPRKPALFPAADLTFAVEPPPPEPPRLKPLPMDSPGGEEEKAEYGLGAAKCPNCKANLAQGSQFCVECGTALATGTKHKGAVAPEGKTKKLKIQLDADNVKKIICGAILAALIAASWWLFTPKGMTEAEMKRDAQQREQQQEKQAPRDRLRGPPRRANPRSD